MQQTTAATPAALLGALGNPVRLRLVAILGEGERCVCELTPEFRQDPSVVCRHLQVLQHSGIICSRRVGARTYYQLTDARILELIVRVLDILEKPGEAKPVGPAAADRRPHRDSRCCPDASISAGRASRISNRRHT